MPQEPSTPPPDDSLDSDENARPLIERHFLPLIEQARQLRDFIVNCSEVGMYDANIEQMNLDFKQILQTILVVLVDTNRWERLREHPAQLQKVLAEDLRLIRLFMQAWYGVESHRPTLNARRDAEIVALRSQGRTFGQIGQKMKISAGAAHRGFERHEKRKHEAEAIAQKFIAISPLLKKTSLSLVQPSIPTA